MKINHSCSKGFTLLEIIISLSLVAMLSGLILVSFNALNNKQSLDTQIDFIKLAITKTRNDALNSRNAADQTFTFATTSITYDGLTIDLDNGVQLSSYTTPAKSIIFARITGFPNATGTIVYKLQKGSTVIATSSISINNLGIIE